MSTSSHYPGSGYDLGQTFCVPVQSLWSRLDASFEALTRALRPLQGPLLGKPGETKEEEATRTLVQKKTLIELGVWDACRNWLESRRYHIAPKTYRNYEEYIKRMERIFQEIYDENAMPFFEQLKITGMDGDLIRMYQEKRKQTVEGELINKELGVIAMVCKRIGKPLLDYQRLPKPKDWETPGRELKPSEEALWKRTCIEYAEHPSWGWAALISLLSEESGMGPGEILSLKREDCVPQGEEYLVVVPKRGAKRISRERPVIIKDWGAWAVTKLLQRAGRLGSIEPGHFLVPYRNHDHTHDPTRSAMVYREAFQKLLAVAGIKFRPYDLRHHAMSQALRDPRLSLTAVRQHFGHVSDAMQKKYYHGNHETSRLVAEAISSKKRGIGEPKIVKKIS